MEKMARLAVSGRRALRVIPSLKRLLGIVFLILAFLWIVREFINTDLLTKIVFKAVFGGFLTACGVRLLSSGTGLKKAWVLVWVLGWILALGAALQVPYSLAQIRLDSDLGDRLASAFWALTTPLQLALGVEAIKLAKRASAPRAEELVTRDPRAPILYLRRFALDSKASLVRTGQEFGSLVFNTKTDEELVAEVMNEIGPCIAIGRPGEKLPHLGFAREYVSDKWLNWNKRT
jgi:hypothetical protein